MVLSSPTRRTFLRRIGAATAGGAALVLGWPREALAATICFAPGKRLGCQYCHTGCGAGCQGPIGIEGHKEYRNWSALTQCCVDHGYDGCIGERLCKGSATSWMSYIGTTYCCGCL